MLHSTSILIYSNKEDVKADKFKVYQLTPFSSVTDTQSELNDLTNNYWVNKTILNCFAVISSAETFIAYTDSINEMHCWVAVIRSAIQRLKKERAFDEEKRRLAENKLQQEREMSLKKTSNNTLEQSFDLQKTHFNEQWQEWTELIKERAERAKDGSFYCVYHKCYHQLFEYDSESEEQEQKNTVRKPKEINLTVSPNCTSSSQCFCRFIYIF